ncbi:hypothetical protein N8482_00710 [Chitinophagales bacterium]|nr:hypothetical protein [Chitinophagales bacterium]
MNYPTNKLLLNLGCLLFITLLLVFSSCEGDNVLPDCIDSELDDFKTVACSFTGELTEWEFDEREVYCFYYGDCVDDDRAEIYDEDCVLLCTLFGLSGNTECEGMDWNSTAILKRSIYVQP